MTSSTIPNLRLPWHDRWQEPELEDLIQPLKAHQQRNFQTLIDQMDECSRMRRSLIWYSSGWKWTVQFTYCDDRGRTIDQFAYLVPDAEHPKVVLPLEEDFIASLPMRRLSKFIRDGIRSAKCAVTIHWAAWTPGPESELNQMTDLVKRKLKYMAQKHGE